MTKKTWRGPDGKPLVVGQLLNVNAAARLGPSVIGTFIVRRFTDEGIVVSPTVGESMHLEIRVQPEDIVHAGLKPA